jgi:hypothetical protein
MSTCQDSSTIGSAPAIRRGEDAVTLTSVSSAEAVLVSKLLCKVNGDSLAKEVHRYLCSFGKLNIPLGYMHPAIAQRAIAVAKGKL